VRQLQENVHNAIGEVEGRKWQWVGLSYSRRLTPCWTYPLAILMGLRNVFVSHEYGFMRSVDEI